MAQQPKQPTILAYVKRYQIESALGLILVLGILATAYLFQQTNAKKEQLAEVRQAVVRAQRNLESSSSPAVEQELQNEFTRIKNEIAGNASQPTLQAAMSVGTDMISYADQQGLRIVNFEDAQERIVVGGVQRPAVRYAFAAEGPSPSLVGVLGILQATSSAIVEDLEMDRSEDAPDLWTIELQTAVFFLDSR